MTDCLLTYAVPGVPELTVGVTDTGQIVLMIADASAVLGDPAEFAALEQVLEQARTDQDGVLRERYPELYAEHAQRAQEQRIARARARIHKAAPDKRPGWEKNPHCNVCGQSIKHVPGGQGMTWVHADSGAVAAPNPPGAKS